MKFVCSACGVISDAVIEYRKDKPMDCPNLRDYHYKGHWAMVAYQIKFNCYLLDHWNRTIVCPVCNNANHYYQKEE